MYIFALLILIHLFIATTTICLFLIYACGCNEFVKFCKGKDEICRISLITCILNKSYLIPAPLNPHPRTPRILAWLIKFTIVSPFMWYRYTMLIILRGTEAQRTRVLFLYDN